MPTNAEAKQKKIIRALKLLAPEFADRDEEDLALMISFVQAQVSESVFGDTYPMACALLTAHTFSTAVSSGSDDGDGSGGGSSGGGSAARGPLLSEKEGDLQRTYGSPSSSSSGGSKGGSSLSNTTYGSAFLDLQKKRVITPMISGNYHVAPGQWPKSGFTS